MKYTLVAICCTLLPVHAAEFINLTFDDPDLSGSLRPVFSEFPNGPFRGDSSQILRGWSLTGDGVPMSNATVSPFGELPASQRTANLIEASPAEWSGPAGRYYIYINSGNLPLGPELRLSQIATVPVDAGGIHIFAPGLRDMRINGQQVTDPRLGLLADPVIDISAYSGRETSFEFVFARGWSGRFDIYGFTQIPEPSTLGLFGVGAVGLFCIMRKSVS